MIYEIVGASRRDCMRIAHQFIGGYERTVKVSSPVGTVDFFAQYKYHQKIISSVCESAVSNIMNGVYGPARRDQPSLQDGIIIAFTKTQSRPAGSVVPTGHFYNRIIRVKVRWDFE